MTGNFSMLLDNLKLDRSFEIICLLFLFQYYDEYFVQSPVLGAL